MVCHSYGGNGHCIIPHVEIFIIHDGVLIVIHLARSKVFSFCYIYFMPSILPGFEHDIFISYRHNDNHSGWVTEFVKALQEELSATIKESVSVYFDTNAHDGLLETYNVEKSLEGKLKSVIFIPIISQTYCYPKSFAWQHELCAFNKLAKEDRFGRDVKLNNGNVASRILPVKIHELDEEDKATIENEIGGALRAVEFIYREPGVNRPLTTGDNPDKNLNKTFYRNQVNKVANAIKEIINSLKNPAVQIKPLVTNQKPIIGIGRFGRTFPIVITALILAASAYLLYPKIFPPEKQEGVIDKSIAVLAFTDMSPNHDQDWFADGISEEIIDRLTHLPELKVIARTSSFYFKGKNAKIEEIGQTLGVNHILEGSVRKIGNQLRITVQLIRVNDGSHLWSEVFEHQTDKLFDIQTEIAETVATKILQDESKRIVISDERPSSMECYEYYLKAMKIVQTPNLSNFPREEEAEELLLMAIKLDPAFASAYSALADLYNTWGNSLPDVRTKYFSLEDSLTQIAWRINPNSAYVLIERCISFFKIQNYDSAFFYMHKASLADPNSSYMKQTIGGVFYRSGLVDQGRVFLIRSLETDPLAIVSRRVLALEQMYLGNFDDAEIGLKKALELDTTQLLSHKTLALNYIFNKNFKEAQREINISQKIQGERQLFSEVLLLARMGDKAGALKLIPNPNSIPNPGSIFLANSIFLCSALGMKNETLHALDSATTLLLKGQIYGSSSFSSFVSLNGLDKSTFYDFIRDEPKFKEIRERVKKDHDEKLKAYRKYFK